MDAKSFPQTIYVTVANAGTSQQEVRVHATEKQALESRPDKGTVATYQRVVVRQGSLEPVFSVEIG